VLGVLVRFVFGEEILLHFGFSPELSNWKFGGSVPIYHGIDQANVRRFQGIFDGPNPAAFFLITYAGILWQFFRARKDDAFLVGLWTLVILFLITYTYSRSSLVGIALGVTTAFVLSIRLVWKKHRKALALSIPLIALLFGAFYLRFENTIDRIILREGSSKGHFDRMVIGVDRFRQHPVFGEGLASSGPAYRYVTPSVKNEDLSRGTAKKEEDYYIPESWYVQQLVEGGIPALGLFLAILFTVAFRLFAFSVPFFAAFVAACSMNLFLHTFESAYASLLLFAFAGLFYAKGPSKREFSALSSDTDA
jgi:O-antigen ligase